MALQRSDLKSISEGGDELTKLILGQKYAQANAEQKQQLDLGAQQAKQNLLDQGANSRFKQVTDYAEAHPNVGVSMGADQAAYTPKPLNPMIGVRMEQMEQGKMEGLSKRYEKLNGFNSALDELEQKTNKDGSGGIITNPSAKLISTGTAASMIPTQAMGLGELIGAVPKGTSDERKSLERLQLEYQKAMSGMRVTDQARKQEKQAMGWMASGDPDLVSKGVRALARNIASAQKTIQAGYAPEVRGRVHDVMGDPNDRYNSIYDDNSQQNSAKATSGKPKSVTQNGHTYNLNEATGEYE